MVKEIQLTQGRIAFVDDEDYERLIQWKWRYERYAICEVNGRVTKMHRLILDAPEGVEVDHCNNNKLDNRKANLRLATRSLNEANKPKRSGTVSHYKGVTWHSSKWRAKIKRNGETHYLGHYDSEIDAAKAYDRAAREAFGEYARLNFPD
jgi:hypothetical protein